MTLAIMLLTSFTGGWFAQGKKGRTGAGWGLLTLAILILVWLVIYFSTVMVQPSLYQTDAGWLSVAILTCGGVGLMMALAVATLPKRHDEENIARRPCTQCGDMGTDPPKSFFPLWLKIVFISIGMIALFLLLRR